ncbi:MAG: zf-TFIIB domain-containing protein [Acidimicrobiales bacterium]
MNCPVDGRELLITHRDGIELDYCPECRGIWFDRGELDKVIERSNLQLEAASVPRERSGDRDDRSYDKDDRSYDKREKYEKPKKKKPTSFLTDLLEFGQ